MLAALDGLADTDGAWLAGPDPHASREELEDLLPRLRRRINALELSFSRHAAAYAARCDPDLDEQSPVAWMRDHCRMTATAAATAIRVGEQEPVLTASVAALGDGRIGFAHLGLLSRTAAVAARVLPSVPFDEAPLLAQAERLRVADLMRACTHAEHALDAAAAVQAAVWDRDFRRLRLYPGDNGRLGLSGSLDAEAGLLLRAALDPLARPHGRDDHRDREQRLGDALVELAGHVLDRGTLPSHGGQRPHLAVTATLETLRALTGAPGGEAGPGVVLPDLTVQRLACDATITRVLLAGSAVVDVGHSRRTVPAATRRALHARDRGCRWPGCDRPGSWTEAHHIRHWVDHGPTNLDNLVLLCRRHHWFVHEVGYRIERDQDGTLVTKYVGVQWDRPRAPD